MKVLAVEDDEVMLMVISGAIRALGHEVLTATDGIQAMEILKAGGIGVVVSDWKMPRMDGMALCREVRRSRDGYVYFILLSVAESTDENHRAALAAGVDDFLSKPFVKRELLARLHVAERILGFTHQVNRLESFLPICMHCRRVRDDKNYWQQIEGYINERTGTQFSHGVCPECYEVHIVPQLRALDEESPPSGHRGGTEGSNPPRSWRMRQSRWTAPSRRFSPGTRGRRHRLQCSTAV
jgi:CheY-like chemotaxis protein